MSSARICSCSLRMFADQALDREHRVGGELGLELRLSCGFGWIGLTRSESLTSTLTSWVRVYFAFCAQARWTMRAARPRSASFSLDMASSFFPAGLHHRRDDEGDRRPGDRHGLSSATSRNQRARADGVGLEVVRTAVIVVRRGDRWRLA